MTKLTQWLRSIETERLSHAQQVAAVALRSMEQREYDVAQSCLLTALGHIRLASAAADEAWQRERPDALGTGGRSRSDRTEGPPLSTAKGNAQNTRWGSQGDSAHTPKGGNDA